MKNYFKSPIKSFLFSIFIWAFVVVSFFSPVLFFDKVLAPLDVLDCVIEPFAIDEPSASHNHFVTDGVTQYLPYHWNIAKSLHEDGYIGWNPYCSGGASIVENTMLSPGDWHHYLSLFMPIWDSWNLSIILHIFLAGVGMLVLLKNRGISGFPSILGAISYAFYSQFIIWIHFHWLLGPMCWAPWIVWALIKARQKSHIIDLPSILFIGLAFRGGHLQSCLYIFTLVLIVWLTNWWKQTNRWSISCLWKTSSLYLVSGIFASLLCMDVFIETIPAYLRGGKTVAYFSFFDALLSIPGYITTFIPTILGIPSNMDALKIFSGSLFDIKYLGGISIILALVACFNKKAPFLAKCLMIMGVIFCITPLNSWFYSRYTCIFGMGASWLAAWQLMQLPQEDKRKLWNKLLIVFSIFVGLWSLISAGVFIYFDECCSAAKSIMLATNKKFSANPDLYILRTTRFFHDCLIWAPRNMIFLSSMGLGLWLCSRIYRQATSIGWKTFLIVLCCIIDIFTFSQTWISYPNKHTHNKNQLYRIPQFIEELREVAGEGSLVIKTENPEYFFLHNLPSAYQIRQAYSYETVQPRRMESRLKNTAQEAAAMGISCLIITPEKEKELARDWILVRRYPKYALYKNPFFKGIYLAQNREHKKALSTLWKTSNRRFLQIPAGTEQLEILETYSEGWRYQINEGAWRYPEKTDIFSMQINFQQPLDTDSTLLLQYVPPNTKFYSFTMAFGIFALLLYSALRFFRQKNKNFKDLYCIKKIVAEE